MIVEKELQEIWKAVNLCTNENVYNINKFALFWKMIPDRTLEIEQSAGRNHNKACITINLACNVTGSHKLEPWFIGKAAKPQYFNRLCINIKNFQIV